MSMHADLRPIDPDDTTVNAPAKSRLPRWPYLVILVLVLAWAGYYVVHNYQWKHSLANAANPVAAQTSFVFPLSSAGAHASFVATNDKAMYSLNAISRTITVYRRGAGDNGWTQGTTTTIKIPLLSFREFGVPQPLVGLAVSPSGVVYTVDLANKEVIRIDASGHIDSNWASSGSGTPIGVVVSKSGKIDVLEVETRFPTGLLTSITQITAAGKAMQHWAVLPGMGTAIAASTYSDKVYVGHAGSVGPDRNTIDVVKPDGTLWTAPIIVPATTKLGSRSYSYDPNGLSPYGISGPGQYLAEYNGVIYLRYDSAGTVIAAMLDSTSIGDARRLVYASGSPAGVDALTAANASNTSVPLLGITKDGAFAGFRHAGSGF